MTLALVALFAIGAADEPSLGLADLPEYRAALENDETGPAEPVGFRDLWDRPEAYQGRRVEIAGQVVRRFHQPALGTFPPLVEAWARSPQGDLFCLVYPEAEAGDLARPGSPIRFRGTFLRRIRYDRQDVPGLAPLIVGGRTPSVAQTTQSPASSPAWRGSGLDWTIGLSMAGIAVLVLGLPHLRQIGRGPVVSDPDPLFEDDPEPERHADGPGFDDP